MTYEYLCALCGAAWEAEQSITEAPLKRCPSCGKDSAKRQISGGMGFILKGGGWYADGYGSGKAETGKEPTKSPEKPANPTTKEASATPSTETKTDSKTEPSKTKADSSSAPVS